MTDPAPTLRIGIDVGGTKIEAAALDRDGAILLRQREPTPANDYAGTLDVITGLVQQIETTLGQSGTVGLGTPGSISPTTGLLRNSNSQCLNRRDIKGDLEARLGRPVRIENDANCMTVSEAVDGAGRDYEFVFGIILGTGVGGGIAINGRPRTGRNAVAGEWGHTPLPWLQPGEVPRRCYCGQMECIESFLSGPAARAEFTELTGRDLPITEIAALAATDDQAAEYISRYTERLARALAVVIDMMDPDAIVLAVGVSNVPQLYEAVPRLLPQWIFSDAITTPILRAQHGDSSGVRGAAWLWRSAMPEDAI